MYAVNVAELNLNETDLEFGIKVELPTNFGGDEMSDTMNYLGAKIMKSDRSNSSLIDGDEDKYYGELNFLEPLICLSTYYSNPITSLMTSTMNMINR